MSKKFIYDMTYELYVPLNHWVACFAIQLHLSLVYSLFLQKKYILSNGFYCFSSGPPGDLYVYLDVEEIPGIQRDGINLSSTVPISYLDAILGALVKVK